MNDNQKKAYISAVYKKQCAPSGNIHRCPRCGSRHREKSEWTLSKHHQVYICPDCKKVEHLMEVVPGPLPLKDWWIFRTLRKAGNLPERPHIYAIELELQDDPNVVQATFECYFDVQKKFDIDFDEYPGDPFINLYADYNVITGDLSMYYVLVSDKEDKCYDYVPTPVERMRIVANMETACMEKDHCTMAGLVQRLTAPEADAPEQGLFMLVEVIDREISPPSFYPTQEDAFKAMCDYMSDTMNVPAEDIIDALEIGEKDWDNPILDDNHSISKDRMSAWVNGKCCYDWKIFGVADCINHEDSGEEISV